MCKPESGWNSRWYSITSLAAERGIPVEITKEEAWDLLVSQNFECALTGLPIKVARYKKGKKETSASLDRIDSSRGYTLDNIQWVHKHVNTIKMDQTMDRFIEICHLVAQRHPLIKLHKPEAM